MTLDSLSPVRPSITLSPARQTSGAAGNSLQPANDQVDLRFGAKPSPKVPQKSTSWFSPAWKFAVGLPMCFVGELLTISIIGAPIGIPLLLAGAGLCLWGTMQAVKKIAKG